MLHYSYLYNLNCNNSQNCILFLSGQTNLSDLLIVKNLVRAHSFGLSSLFAGATGSPTKRPETKFLGIPLSARTVNFCYSWILTSSSVVIQRKLFCEYRNLSLQFFNQWDDDENEDIFDS